jgi:hypothetical protein
MIYTAPCVMLLMRAALLRDQVGGGWALAIESFLCQVNWNRADRRVPFGAQITPHPYKPLNGTIKKSTAPYKLHNIRLRYIKEATSLIHFHVLKCIRLLHASD